MPRRKLLALGVLALALLIAGLLHHESGPDTGAGDPPPKLLEVPPQPDPADLRPPGDPDEPEKPSGDSEVADHQGRFSFHYRQGYSFHRRAVVPPEEADLVFNGCAGGISSVTLQTPGGGITNLRSFRRECREAPSPLLILYALREAKPDVVRLSAGSSGDERTPTSNVFLLRTGRGEWVRLAIVTRGKGGSWTKQPVTVEYDLRSGSPVFGEAEEPVEKGGIVLDRSVLGGRRESLGPKERQRLVGEWERLAREAAEEASRAAATRQRLRNLDKHALALEGDLRNRGEGRSHVSAVLTRGAAKPLGDEDAYTVSTFSFELNSRDDREKSRNDWDFVLQGGKSPHLWVTTVSDDRSRIRDLGPIDLDAARRGEVPPGAGGQRAEAMEGHVYLIHTLDSDSDHWALMKILELQASEAMVFRWEILDDPGPLLTALVPPERELRAPVARLQIRGGAGGGNSRGAYLDGTVERGRVDRAKEPLDCTGTIDSRERCRSYVEGGHVPTGTVFLIRSIEYTARADGDSNGPGSFLLWVGPFRVAAIERNRNAESKDDRRAGVSRFRLKTIDGGMEEITQDDFPVTRRLAVLIPIRPGREKDVYVQIRNSSYGDVTLRGDLVPSDELDSRLDPRKEGLNIRGLWWYLDSVVRSDRWEHLAEEFAGRSPQARPWLEAILGCGARGEYRRRIEYTIARMPK